MKKLENKVAVITGGNSGIGLATAKLFHEEGAKVVLTGRRKEVVESSAKEVGVNATGIVNDTSDLKDIDSLYEQVDKLHGKIDVLFLNAGIAIYEPFEHTTEASFDRQFNTNVKGLYFNIQKALPLMKNGGSIVLTTSIANQIGMPNTSAYSATKAAVRSFARTLSAELIEKGIRVNCVSPGPIETPIFTKMGIPPEAVNDTKLQIASGVPMKRMGTADEVAKAALFLASSDSSFTTGIDLTVDGGMASL